MPLPSISTLEHMTPDDLWMGDSLSHTITFIYTKDGRLIVGSSDETHNDIIDRDEQLQSLWEDLTGHDTTTKADRNTILRARKILENQFALLGRSGRRDMYVEDDYFPYYVVTFWNEKSELYDELLEGFLKAFDDYLPDSVPTYIITPFDVTPYNELARAETPRGTKTPTHSDRELLKKMHLMRGDEKKAAMRQLGLGWSRAKEHPMTTAMKKAGKLIPGGKWWASQSEGIDEIADCISEDPDEFNNLDGPIEPDRDVCMECGAHPTSQMVWGVMCPECHRTFCMGCAPKQFLDRSGLCEQCRTKQGSNENHLGTESEELLDGPVDPEDKDEFADSTCEVCNNDRPGQQCENCSHYVCENCVQEGYGAVCVKCTGFFCENCVQDGFIRLRRQPDGSLQSVCGDCDPSEPLDESDEFDGLAGDEPVEAGEDKFDVPPEFDADKAADELVVWLNDNHVKPRLKEMPGPRTVVVYSSHGLDVTSNLDNNVFLLDDYADEVAVGVIEYTIVLSGSNQRRYMVKWDNRGPADVRRWYRS